MWPLPDFKLARKTLHDSTLLLQLHFPNTHSKLNVPDLLTACNFRKAAKILWPLQYLHTSCCFLCPELTFPSPANSHEPFKAQLGQHQVHEASPHCVSAEEHPRQLVWSLSSCFWHGVVIAWLSGWITLPAGISVRQGILCYSVPRVQNLAWCLTSNGDAVVYPVNN